MPGIWVSENQYMDFSETIDKTAIMDDIAVRSRAWDWGGFFGLMPDPDPVLRKLADGGVSVLESLTADGHLCSVIQSRKLGTLKKEFKWGPGTVKDEKPSAAAQKLADEFTADLENIDTYNLLSGILDAPYYGMAPVEISWRAAAGKLSIGDILTKPSRWFGFDEDNVPKFISTDNPWDGEALPFGKFVFARHFPTYDNPYGLRLLSRCFWPVAFKKGGWKFWITLAQKFGVPFLLGKHRIGATGAEKQSMLSDLAAMVADAVAVIPQGGAVEILERQASGSKTDIHGSIISACNAEISKVLMGQTLTAEVSAEGGSRAQGQVHEDILEDFRAGDQTLVKSAMEEIAWIYGQVNAPGVPAPEFSWFEEDDPKSETATRDKTLADGGVRFTKSYYVRQYGFQEDDLDVAENNPLPDGGPGSDWSRARGQAAFAEAGAKTFTPDQQALEDFADTVTAAAANAMAQKEEKIRAVVEKAESYEDAMAGLLDLYPDMDFDDLAGIMDRTMVNAELFGKSTVKNESK